jgi:predicted O-linked N-acetylglucosamine transferase (SPINDLY family)
LSGQSAQIFAKAVAAFQSGRLDDAERDFKKFLRREPDHFGALNLYAALLIRSERFKEAEPILRKAISINSTSDKTFYNYGLVLKKLKKFDSALDAFSKSIAIDPYSAETWNNRGTVFNDLKRYNDAISDFDRAIALVPTYAEAYFNKGRSLFTAKRLGDALAAFEKATQQKPDLAEAWIGRGDVHFNQWNYPSALANFEQALAFKATSLEALDHAHGRRLHAATHLCLWNDTLADWKICIEGVNKDLPTIHPFALISTPASAAEQLLCATQYVSSFKKNIGRPARAEKQSRDRIKIAYLSGDFRDHPVSVLLSGLLEHHDKSKFETIGISFLPESDTPIGQRIKSAFDEFHDVSEKSDLEVAELMDSLQIDIAIDLVGHTGHQRPGIFELRPAPVQVGYLGYPGTTGDDAMDYIIGDQIVIPNGHENFYSENIVRLPNTYLPTDRTRSIAEDTPSRTEAGLPERGFVFCSFNNSFKITPAIFDVWMRLLKQIEGCVLWLPSLNEIARDNLRREAQARGIAPNRLIFAQRLDKAEDHLARYRLADLFLDTIYYNAHTTAADALWAGLPLITCTGTTFAGRVAASLLNAIGMPELVTTSLEDYEALALKLARDPGLLASIKAKLAANRLTTPLFDTERYTRQLEAAYTKMWQRAQNGEAPESFDVEPLP